MRRKPLAFTCFPSCMDATCDDICLVLQLSFCDHERRLINVCRRQGRSSTEGARVFGGIVS